MDESQRQILSLVDRFAVQDVIATYFRAVDRKDWQSVRSVFDDAARFDGTRWTGDLDDYFPQLQASCDARPVMVHFTGNQQVLVEADAASAETYAIVILGDPRLADGQSIVRALIYEDSLTRTATGWKIVSRRVRETWTISGPGVDR